MSCMHTIMYVVCLCLYMYRYISLHMAWYDMARNGLMLWQDNLTGYDLIRQDLTWYGMEYYAMVRKHMMSLDTALSYLRSFAAV